MKEDAGKRKVVTSKVYDGCAIVISLADISTDLWMLARFHAAGRSVPFFISLSILIAAQISYVLAFLTRFMSSSKWDCSERLLVSAVITPISLLLSFVFYFASLPNCCVHKWMKDFGFKMEDPTPSENMSLIKAFVYEKFWKHMGFLLEACVEAFPQSILQMAVMVSYAEADWVSVASILLSLISVCSKSLVFSNALDFRTFLFNYLSIVTDFVSIFAIISWIFFNPRGAGISQLGQLYIWKVAIFTAPMVFICGASFCWIMFWEIFADLRSHTHGCLFCLCFPFGVAIWLIGSAFVTLMAELCCCSGLAFIIYLLFWRRFSTNSTHATFWGRVFSFMRQAHDESDKLLRTCVVNECVLSSDTHMDRGLNDFLRQSRQSLYANVTWAELRQHSKSQKNTPMQLLKYEWRKMWKDAIDSTKYVYSDCGEVAVKLRGDRPCHVCFDGCVLPFVAAVGHLLFPLYVCSRVANVSFVWVCVLCTKWPRVEWLQLALTAVFGVLQLAWFCALVSVLKMHRMTWHIAAGQKVYLSFYGVDAMEKTWKKATDLHDAYSIEPFRRQAIREHFGPDIGGIVISYLPTLLRDIELEAKKPKYRGHYASAYAGDPPSISIARNIPDNNFDFEMI